MGCLLLFGSCQADHSGSKLQARHTYAVIQDEGGRGHVFTLPFERTILLRSMRSGSVDNVGVGQTLPMTSGTQKQVSNIIFQTAEC